MEDGKIALYMHAGSGNHGCEAIVRSLTDLLYEGGHKGRPLVMTNDRNEDLIYMTEDKCVFKEEQHMDRHFWAHVLYYIYRKISGDKESFLRYRFRDMLEYAPDLAISIGGDTYCYESMVEDIMLANSMLTKRGIKTILLGCSVEPSLVKRADIVKDMQRYEKIFARESITYNALLDAGLTRDKVELIPDPAFTMFYSELPLPEGWKEANTIGLNLSPLIGDYARDKDTALSCYEGLIEYLIENTDSAIALIPHVVWDRSNDMIPLEKLYNRFYDTGRVILLGDHTAPELKGYIRRLKLFIGARTHATIAAYSSCVPTLVIGYSVKARGIARDLFGREKDYVLPVQELEDPRQLIEGYKWLDSHRDEIKTHLEDIMPAYIERSRCCGQAVSRILRG
ncbi:polysaccharide pyruvyl transferase family protein [Butyrivibrio sp. MC2013]|uniref:polysaccharide pyruvyl transferase family protein n=1 Tax=Butyrivibrio sp. MC2013 TaxID=1280686 RepID=UPI00041F67BB|nr:polysaccharide pyruvyl transferase family protein [Butyrivibrio sp. MC2013]